MDLANWVQAPISILFIFCILADSNMFYVPNKKQRNITVKEMVRFQVLDS